MPFRNFLVWVQKSYASGKRNFFLSSGLAAVVSLGLALMADLLLPWDQWAIFVRALVAIPGAVSVFVFSYGFTLYQASLRRKRNNEYETWRAKLSPRMRTQASAVVGAVLFVVMFSVTMQPGYTIIAALVVAAITGLFAFMRKTSLELNRERIGLPDSRDTVFANHMRDKAKESARKKDPKGDSSRGSEHEKKLALEKKLER